MKKLWACREVDAPADVLWMLITDLERWPQWGPSVRRAALDNGGMRRGATGTVTTAVGVEVGFEITDFKDGERWAWKVAGIPATDHIVEALGPNSCRIKFGVPWVAAPYLAVCEIALRRLDTMATMVKAEL